MHKNDHYIIPNISPLSYLISVEGNIGSGKSTFLKKINQDLNFHIIYEPSEQWQNVKTHNLLDEFYKDMSRWAYSFQSYVFLTRLKAIETNINLNSPINIVERSVYTDKFCFAKVLHTLGHMTDLEWHMYTTWYDWIVEGYVYPMQGIIYLQVDPEVSFDRIHIRNRHEENKISIDYIKMLHDNHEDWLIHKKGLSEKLKNIPVLTLDCNQDFEHTQYEWDNILSKVKNFIKSISNT
jgi:deoxyadenosine/deoxycytidine kinase